jgi:putative flippase GtrA
MEKQQTLIGWQARFAKFVVVGLSGTILDYSLFLFLKSWGWQTGIANMISASLGMFNNFYWNRQWTFSKPLDKSSGVQFIQYFIVSLIGLGINTMVIVAVEEPCEVMIPNAQLGCILAKLLATGAAFVWNYLANLNWTFHENQPRMAG